MTDLLDGRPGNGRFGQMTWAPGISTITSRVDVIQGLLSSRASARPQEPSTEAAFVASTAGFDPFGAAYQQALVSAGVNPAPATSTAAVDGSTPSDVAAVSPAPGASMSPVTSTAPAMATESTASTASTGLTGSTGSTDPSAISGLSLSSDVIRTASLDLTIGTRRPAGSYVDPFAGMLAATNLATTYGSANASTNYGTSYGSAASAANSVLIGATFPPVVGAGSSVGQVGGYGKMPVPADLAAYGNGQIPIDSLETIGQGGHRLYAPAAESYKALVAAAKLDGIDLTVTDSYRTYDQQVDLAARKGIYADGGLAAVPGTSNHGWGLAVDFNVNSPAALEWLKNNGHSFGWVEAVKREPWHWEFRPTQA